MKHVYLESVRASILGKLFIYTSIFVISMFLIASPFTGAMSPEQKSLYKQGVYYYDIDSCQSADTETGADAPIDNVDGVSFETGMTVNTDGVGSSHGNRYHQPHTSYKDGELNADKTNFLALAQQWAKNNNLELGDLAVVQYKGKTAYAIYGDNWQNVDQIHGEGSYRLVKELGMSFNGTSGGADSGVKYTLYPKTAHLLKGSIEQSKINEIGQQLSGGPNAEAPPAGGAVCCSDGGRTVPGNNNEEKVWNFFIDKLKPFQVAGIIGNMHAESSVEPQRLQGTPSGTKTPAESVSGNIGWGLVQWTPASKFIDPTKAAGKDPNDIGVQLEFLWDQLEGRGPSPEKQAGDDLKATVNYKDAVRAFQGDSKIGGKYTGYERPKDEGASLNERFNAAYTALSKYGSGSPGGMEVSTGGAPCGGEINSDGIAGEFSLPVDKKYKQYFNNPHHDYAAIDIPVPNGAKIYSVTSGEVVGAASGENGGMGTYVSIKYNDGFYFKYFHGIPGSIKVKSGDKVSPGQLLMLADNTGSSYGDHLHLEIRTGDEYGGRKCPQGLLTGIVEGKVPTLESLPESGCSY